MSQTIAITSADIIEQVKLSCQVPELTEGILGRQIIAKAATEAGIKLETEELQKAADQMRLIRELHNAKETWNWLEKHSLSINEFQNIAYHSLISGKLVAHLFADKVEPYFFENQLDYTKVVMYEVVLDDEDLAMELFYAIQEEEISFYEVAHQYIQEPELRRAGGYRGILHRQDLKPEISAAVFAAHPPQLLKPIVTAKGVHLVFVEEIITPELNDQLRYKILTHLFAEWMKQQIEQVEVVMQLNHELKAS